MARILVVDDEAGARHRLRDVLLAHGHEVILAEDGTAGISAYRTHRPDVVIVDVVMPKKSGIEMILELRELDPRAKVIAMSGVAGPEFLAAGREVGVAGTLEKPFDRDAVIAVVDEVLRR